MESCVQLIILPKRNTDNTGIPWSQRSGWTSLGIGFNHTYVMENQWNMQIGGKMNNEIIQFVNGDLQIDVTVSPNNETVWLTQKQMSELFDVKSQAITRH